MAIATKPLKEMTPKELRAYRAEVARLGRAAHPGDGAAYMRKRRAAAKGVEPGAARGTRIAPKPLKEMSPEEMKAYRADNCRRSYEKNLLKIQAKRVANSEAMKAYWREYQVSHREEKASYRREHNKTDEARLGRKQRESTEEFRKKHSAQVCDYIKRNKEKVTKRSREWRARTGWNNKYHEHKWQTDLGYKLRMTLRNRLRAAMKNKVKSGSAVELLGCSIEAFIIYIEAKFQPGMTWQNRKAWHIDHKRALATFDLTNAEQLKAACHYTNLQPLWAADNIRKGAKQ